MKLGRQLLHDLVRADEEEVRAADRALDRMRRLIDDLLVLARQGTSVDPDDTAPVSIGDTA